jgi:hypothetical protein
MTEDIVTYEVVNDGDILIVRGQRVILDARVAEAFGTETKHVNQAVSRNRDKFDGTHCFQITEREDAGLRSQSVTSNAGRGGARYLPHVFTIKGVARLATVLSTPAALRAKARAAHGGDPRAVALPPLGGSAPGDGEAAREAGGVALQIARYHC